MNPRALRARYLWSWGVLLLILVLADLALFGWLILRSLSRDELKRVLEETQARAEELARQIESGARRSGGDLLTALLLEEETLTSIDEVIRERRFVRTLEVRDPEGQLVLRRRTETELFDPGVVVRKPEEPGPSPSTRHTIERRESLPIPLTQQDLEQLEIQVPIGQLGSLYFSLEPELVRTRLEQFRRKLLFQALGVGALTLILGVFGTLGLLRLVRRTELLESQAREAERFADLGKLAAGLAHEIRNPLNALSLNLQVLEESRAENSREATLLSGARSELERLNRLVTDFLTFARPRPPRRERLDLADLLQRVTAMFESECARSGSGFEVELEEPHLEVEADRDQLCQILLNLFRNALQAAEEVGRPIRVHLRARHASDAIELSIADNGPGMDEETARRAFELFYSTRKGGSGLGLALVESLVRAHHGSITLDSKLGQGTRITIRLPAPQRPLCPSEPPVNASNSSSVAN